MKEFFRTIVATLAGILLAAFICRNHLYWNYNQSSILQVLKPSSKIILYLY